MWATDFDESLAYTLEENCLEALMVQIPWDSGPEMRDENTESVNGGLQQNHRSIEHSISDREGMKSASNRHFCGLTRRFWSRNDQMQICAAVSSTKREQDELPVFCVAAILIMNRQKIIRETHSIDDMIKASALCWIFIFMFVIKLKLLLFFPLFFFSCLSFVPFFVLLFFFFFLIVWQFYLTL